MSAQTAVRPGEHVPPSRTDPYAIRKRPPLYRRRTRAAWGFALPFMLLFLTFTLGPVLMSLAMAVTDLRLSLIHI